eukprot:TRINITY_DN29220_c0_g1_i1.p1 TRINITY_DN29220_c0_g1~~TRINITY_DN29220_c0_g1_i1.p1  ORF type:complete len:481 (-),score=98.01 TRINITY_DN29220_c0_g1_i1:9-1451(-)
MQAPEWYRTGRGKGAVLPPPPGMPTPQNPLGVQTKAPPQRKAPAPPSRPPPGPKGAPPLPALPAPPGATGAGASTTALAVLPPPKDAAAASASPSGAGEVALALRQDAASPGAGAIQRSSVKAAPATGIVSEKAFVIPGLQNRSYVEDELIAAFEMIDLENHGFLHPNDLRRALELTNTTKEPSEAEVSEMIRLCDLNGNGLVEMEEFIRFFSKPPPLFRNYDLSRAVEGLNNFEDEEDGAPQEQGADGDDPDRAASGSSGTPAPAPLDRRVEAVATISEGRKKLTPKFIKRVYQTFIDIDKDDYGFVTYEAFCLVLAKVQSPAMRQAFDIFDVDGHGELDLRQFVVSLSMFTTSSPVDKIRFAFMMYDEDQQGSLMKSDLLELMKAMVPHILAEDRRKHVNRCFSLNNLHPDMQITMDEFVDYVADRSDELVPQISGANSLRSSQQGTPKGSQGDLTPTYSGTGTPSDGPSRGGSRPSR